MNKFIAHWQRQVKAAESDFRCFGSRSHKLGQQLRKPASGRQFISSPLSVLISKFLMTMIIYSPRDWYKGIMDSADSLNKYLLFETFQESSQATPTRV